MCMFEDGGVSSIHGLSHGKQDFPNHQRLNLHLIFNQTMAEPLNVWLGKILPQVQWATIEELAALVLWFVQGDLQ